MLPNCAAFKEEKLEIEVLMEGLPSKSHNNKDIELFLSPKSHCELSGEGVEYVWAVHHNIKDQ